jgi:Cof subfamily protein (haloacid dehalogenase superfamily)
LRQYDLVLFDLDGTLLSETRSILSENCSALERLVRSGVKVGLATGRTYRSARPYAEMIAANGPLILFNGARVWDCSKGEYTYRRDLPREEALIALELAREVDGGHVNLYVGDDILIESRTPRSIESEEKDGVPHTVVGDLTEFLLNSRENPVKIMLIAEPEQLEAFALKFRARSKGAAELIRSELRYLEFTGRGVNKGSALGEALRGLGIPKERVISFGDHLNDVEMLLGSGLGVAMENAHSGLKAIAHRVIGPHTGGAIRLFLEETFPEQLGAG